MMLKISVVGTKDIQPGYAHRLNFVNIVATLQSKLLLSFCSVTVMLALAEQETL
jgi:hypothetical protein